MPPQALLLHLANVLEAVAEHFGDVAQVLGEWIWQRYCALCTDPKGSLVCGLGSVEKSHAERFMLVYSIISE